MDDKEYSHLARQVPFRMFTPFLWHLFLLSFLFSYVYFFFLFAFFFYMCMDYIYALLYALHYALYFVLFVFFHTVLIVLLPYNCIYCHLFSPIFCYNCFLFRFLYLIKLCVKLIKIKLKL